MDASTAPTTRSCAAGAILTQACKNAQSRVMIQGYRKRSALGLIFTPFRMALIFSGRSTRTDLLGWWLLGGLFLGLLGIVVDMVFTATGLPIDIETWIGQALNLAIAFASIALSVRRLHDIGHSGWWVALLIGMVATGHIGISFYAAAHPDAGVEVRYLSVHLHSDIAWTATLAALVTIEILAALGSLALMLIPGTLGANRYGPDPRPGPDPGPAKDAPAL
jgi:uncharacterized membrane protein YhaH (DUF805 family)